MGKKNIWRRWSNNNLVTWRQRRCTKCGRFLNKEQLIYCSKCRRLVKNKRQREYVDCNHEKVKESKRRSYHKRRKEKKGEL